MTPSNAADSTVRHMLLVKGCLLGMRRAIELEAAQAAQAPRTSRSYTAEEYAMAAAEAYRMTRTALHDLMVRLDAEIADQERRSHDQSFAAMPDDSTRDGKGS